MIAPPTDAAVTGVLAQVLWTGDGVVVTNLAERCRDGLGPRVEGALARLRSTALRGSDDAFARFVDDRLKLWQAGNGSLLQTAPSGTSGSAPRSIAHQGRPEASSAARRHPNLRPSTRTASAAEVRPLADIASIAMPVPLEPEAPSAAVGAKPTLPPLDAALLVERSVPMRRLRELVAAGHRTIVISGIPGAGKRTLAMQFGHGLPDDGFPGGRKVVAAVRDEERVQDVALQLWDELVGSTPSFSNPAIMGERLRNELSSRGRMLFILEDVRTADIARALRQALPQDALIVITSEATHLAADLGAQGCHLDGMSAEEATELFARVLNHPVAELRLCPWLNELMAEVDRHPLCLQIAARRLHRCHDSDDWPATAARLRDEVRTGQIGSALDEILSRVLFELPEEVQRRAMLLGAMAPGVAFDTAGAAALWEAGEAEAPAALHELVEVGVLYAVRAPAGEPGASGADAAGGDEPSMPAWRQPAPIRGFCLDSLKHATESLAADSGPSLWVKAARQHAQHYTKGIRSGQYRIAATLPQLRHAMDWALGASDVPACVELFDAFLQPRVCMFVARELLAWVRRMPGTEASGEAAPADLLARLFEAIASLMGAAVDSQDHGQRIQDVLAYCDGILQAPTAAEDRPFRMFLLALKSRALCAGAAFAKVEGEGELPESVRTASAAWELLAPEDDAALRAFVAFSLADAERLVALVGLPLPDDRRKRMLQAYDIAIDGWHDTGSLVSLVRSCRALALTDGLSVSETQDVATWDRAMKDLRSAMAACADEDDRPMRGLIGLCCGQALVARATAETGEDQEATARAEAHLREAGKVCTEAIACLDRRMMPLPCSVAFCLRATARFLQTLRTGQRQHALRALGDLHEVDALLNGVGPGSMYADMLVLWARVDVYLAFQETDDAAGIAALEKSVDRLERALRVLTSDAESFTAAHYLQMLAGTILVISGQREDLLPATFTSARIIAEAPAVGGEERIQAVYVELDSLMRLKDFPGEDAGARLEEALQTLDALQDMLPEDTANEGSAILALMRAAFLYERARRSFDRTDAGYAAVCELADRASSLLEDDPTNVVCEAAHLWRMIAQAARTGGFALGHAACALQTLLDRTNYLESLANRGPQIWYPYAAARACIDTLLAPESGALAPGLRAQLLLLDAGLRAEAAIAGIPTSIAGLREAHARAGEACRLLDRAGNIVEESIARLTKANLMMTLAALGGEDRRSALRQVLDVNAGLRASLDPEASPQVWLSIACRQSSTLLALAALPGEDRQGLIADAVQALWEAYQRLSKADPATIEGARAALQELRAVAADVFDEVWPSRRLGDCPDWLSLDDPVVRERTFEVALNRFVECREAAGRNYGDLETCQAAVDAGRRLQRISDRLQYRERAAAVVNDLARAHLGLGEALARVGRVDEALGEFDQAERTDPADPDLRRSAVEALLEAGRPTDARKRFKICEHVSPRPDWLDGLGQRLREAERRAAAEIREPGVSLPSCQPRVASDGDREGDAPALSTH